MPFEVKYHQMEEGLGEVTGSILFVKIWIRLHVLPPTAHLNFPEGKMSESALTVSFLDNFWRGKKKDTKVRHYEVKNQQPNGPRCLNRNR